MRIVAKKDNQGYLEVKCILNKQLIITENYWQKIITIKHPSIKGREKEVESVLRLPDIVKVGKSDIKVFLYYKKYQKNYLCVVVRHQNGKGFIITVYITNKIKEGKLVWTKQK